MKLKFTVHNQNLRRIDKNIIVNKSQNYLKFHFDFRTEDWEGTNKFVQITNETDTYNLPLPSDNILDIPSSILDTNSFRVSVYGTIGETRITTTPRKVAVVSSDYTTEYSSIPDDGVTDIFVYVRDTVDSALENFHPDLSTKADVDHTHIVNDITDYETKHQNDVIAFCNELNNKIRGG